MISNSFTEKILSTEIEINPEAESKAVIATRSETTRKEEITI
jgi:hypothetical protein